MDGFVRDYVGKDVRLVGFDPVADPCDALRAEMRLAGEHDRHSWEGVVVLDVDGKRIAWVLRVDGVDGYRSQLAPLYLCKVIPDCLLQFPNSAIPVTVSHVAKGWENHAPDRECDVVRLTDASNHVWLEFGTDDTDDYYPVGFVQWLPKEPG